MQTPDNGLVNTFAIPFRKAAWISVGNVIGVPVDPVINIWHAIIVSLVRPT